MDSNSEANFERLRNGGVFASVLTRVTRNRTRTVRVKPGVRLHDVVAKVDELNDHQRFVAKFGSLSFDPTDITSETAERLLDHYTDEYRVDYDDMDLYRDFKKVVDPIEWKDAADEQINDTMEILMDIVAKYSGVFDTQRLPAEYESEIRQTYRGNSNVQDINYFDFWMERMNNDRFQRDCPNLCSLLNMIWTIVYSNAESERLVHRANAFRSLKRSNMSMILLNAFMHIAVNKLALSDCDDLIKMGIDYWYKIGGLSADSCSSKDLANCQKIVDEHYKAAANTGTEYAQRKERRELRQKQNKSMWE